MNLECSQIMLSVSDIARTREFYIEKLGMDLIEEYPTMFAFRAGPVRFTVVGGGICNDPDEDIPDPPATIMFRSRCLMDDVVTLKSRNVSFLGDISEAPGFMKHIALLDPDNNVIYICEYYRDPLLPEG